MAQFRKIGVLTSGGDSPAMNSAVRAVAGAALAHGVGVVGIMEGYKGLMEDIPGKSLIDLSADKIANISQLSGTILYSARALEFKTEEGMAKAIATCRRHDIDGIVAIGGDGTFRGATDLSIRGIPTIGLPGTIDNDITSTDNSIGFDTAMNTAVHLCDQLRDTCESHARCNVVELMGRHAGYVALQTAIAVGAIGVVTLEMDFDEEKLMRDIENAKAQGQRSFLVLIAEGVPLSLAEQGKPGYSEALAKRIQERTGVETKFCRPAHMLRGGAPTLRDRLLASRMGYEAVELLLQGKSDLVVCEQRSNIVAVNIRYALILDRMYKGKLRDGDLDAFTPAEVEEMKSFCAAKKAEFADLYKVANTISAYPAK